MDLSIKNLGRKISNFFLGEAGGGSSGQITNSNLKNFIVKHIGWNSESDDFSASENDLSEVQSAISTDSYIKVALDKTAQLVMKSGYMLESNNESALQYLKQRLAIMEFGTKIPFDILLTEIARNLVYYSNCFIVKSRIDKIQGGLQAKAVLGKKPVGGYYIMDPTIVEIKRDKTGAVVGYKLTGTEETEFKAEDVVHFYIDRDAGNNFGTPRIISCLEDVKILRKIEGNTLSLIYRFSIPLYQMKIGLPETNFMATNQEITEAQKQINTMPMDGIIVTNERTQFLAVGAEGKAIDLSTYLKYYENRVFSGLNVSEAMMGRGGSKQDADSMEGLMHDTVKHYQAAMTSFIEQGLFNEILLEGGFNPIFNEEDKVKFVFNEINIDTQIKYENHLLNQFQGNTITFEELRKGLGRTYECIDESRLYSNMITKQNEIEILNAKVSASAESGNGNLSNGSGQKSYSSNKAASNTDQPQNQHGTTSAKAKESDQSWHVNQENVPLKESPEKNQPNPVRSAKAFYNPERRQRILTFRLEHSGLFNTYSSMRNDITEKSNFTQRIADKYIDEFTKEFDSELEKYSRLGYKKSQLSGTEVDPVPDKIEIPEFLTKMRDRHVQGLISDLKEEISKSGDRNIVDCFDFMEYRLRFASDYLTNKAFNYALIDGYKKQGIKTLKLALSENHSSNESTISTDNFDINQIPPFTSYCRCEIIEPEVQIQWQ